MRPRHPRAAVLSLGLAAVALGGACARGAGMESTPAPDSPMALKDEARQVLDHHLDEQWQLVSGTVNDEAIEPVAGELVTFGASRDPEGDLGIGGHVCNGFRLTVEGERAGDLVSTAMLCHDDLMAIEGAVMRALPLISDVIVDGNTMTLTGDGVDLTLTAATDAP